MYISSLTNLHCFFADPFIPPPSLRKHYHQVKDTDPVKREFSHSYDRWLEKETVQEEQGKHQISFQAQLPMQVVCAVL